MWQPLSCSILCLTYKVPFQFSRTYFLCQAIGEKLSEIGGRLDYPCLNKELAQDIETLWKDAAIQVAFTSHKGHMLIALQYLVLQHSSFVSYSLSFQSIFHYCLLLFFWYINSWGWGDFNPRCLHGKHLEVLVELQSS